MEIDVMVGEKVVTVSLDIDESIFEEFENEKDMDAAAVEEFKYRKEEVKRLALQEYGDTSFDGNIKIMYETICN